jgi:hypothetical protein
MTLVMVPLLLLSVIAALVYGFWRVVRKWGTPGAFFVAAIVSFVTASGVLAERLWGPQWSWNFGHHERGYGSGALIQGAIWLAMGLRFRAQRRNAN